MTAEEYIKEIDKQLKGRDKVVIRKERLHALIRDCFEKAKEDYNPFTQLFGR